MAEKAILLAFLALAAAFSASAAREVTLTALERAAVVTAIPLR